MLREAGLVQIVGGVCGFTPGRQAEAAILPDNLQGVIGYRLDLLTPEEQLTLKVASVIGRVFAARTLLAVHPIALKTAQLHQQLAAAERMNLVVRDTSEPDGRYEFRHIIAQEVAYSLLPGTLQRTLHHAVARCLEQTYPAEQLPHYLLAHHWRSAGEHARARDYLDLAAAGALREGSYREALTILGQADALEEGCGQPDSPASVAWRAIQERCIRREHMLGEAWFGLGEPAQARQHIRRALALMGSSVPDTQIGLVAGSVKHLLHYLARSRSMPGRLAQHEALSALAEEAALYALYARITYGNNETLLAAYAILRYLVVAEQLASAAQRIQAYVSAGAMFTALRLPVIANRFMARANQLMEKPTLPITTNFVTLVQGVTDIGQARWSEGIPRLEYSVVASRKLSDWRTWGDSTVMLGLAYYYQGQFAQSAHWFHELATVGAQRGSFEHQAYGHNGLGMVALRRGQLAEACVRLERAGELLEQAAELQMAKLMNQGARAVLYDRQGRWLEAEAMASQVAHATGLLPYTFHPGIDGLLGWAEVALQLLARRPGKRLQTIAARKAIAALQRYALIYPLGRPAFWRYRARLALLRGKKAMARRAAYRSLAAARHLAMPHDEGLAHADLGGYLPLTSPQRRVHLAMAVAVFSRIDACDDLERTITAAREQNY